MSEFGKNSEHDSCMMMLVGSVSSLILLGMMAFASVGVRVSVGNGLLAVYWLLGAGGAKFPDGP